MTDCRRTELCDKYGYCERIQRDGTWRCAVASAADCRSSEACREWGLCHADLERDGPATCVAVSDEDCVSSRRCETDRRCFALGGTCHRAPE
jgi:hypothetical protein